MVMHIHISDFFENLTRTEDFDFFIVSLVGYAGRALVRHIGLPLGLNRYSVFGRHKPTETEYLKKM